MPERNSERKMIWAVIIIVGAQLLGIDLQQLLALAVKANDAVTAAQATAGGVDGNIALTVAAGLYTWCRTDIKKKRDGGKDGTDNG